jgi:serine/threonine-protein kinase
VERTVADPTIGRVLDGRYLVGPRIARGGMATVYEATDLRLDRVCALKIMHAGLGDDDDFAARFVREARSAARLSHPNVVGVFDQGDDDGTLFLAMEHVPGHTLRDLIRKEAPMAPAKALSLLEPILAALGAAHQAGLIHRDVKPENVLLADDGRVKVADFGLARAVSAETQHTATGGVLIGTVSYLAPELVVDRIADARSDVYAAGVLLYEMLTGRKPHEGDSPIQVAYKHVHEDVPSPSALVPAIPAYVDALVARATARDRDLRPADARVLLHQVRRVRAALDQGVTDDPELTADLTPTVPVPGRPEDFVDYVREEAPVILEPAQYVAAGSTEAPTAPPDHASSKSTPEQTSRIPSPRAPGSEPPRRPAPPRRRRRGPMLLALALLLIVATGMGAWWFGIDRYTTTPGVIDLTAAQARTRIVADGLHYTVEGRAFSETVPAGSVISTDPSGGARIVKHGTVAVTLSKGPERFAVPVLRGMTVADAKAALAKVHLVVGRITRRYDAAHAKGMVLASTPAANIEVRRGRAVDLVVSKGRRPIPVPDFQGKPAGAAVRALRRLHFKVSVTRVNHDSIPKGDVISQDPDSGTAFRGTTINLQVSKGPVMVPVPRVVEMGTQDAVATLQAAGFSVTQEHSALYVGLQFVVRQSPSPGELAPRGSVVTIYLV